MNTASPFHQAEDPVFPEPEFCAELVGGYDTSQVFSSHFLEPHIIPSLPNWKPFATPPESPPGEPEEPPKSPSGATYTFPRLARKVEDHIFARRLLAPSYEHVAKNEVPEVSTEEHMTELRGILKAAKQELRESYFYVLRTEEAYSSVVEDRARQQSRWEQPVVQKGRDRRSVSKERVRKRGPVKKQRIHEEAFGGTLVKFE